MSALQPGLTAPQLEELESLQAFFPPGSGVELQVLPSEDRMENIDGSKDGCPRLEILIHLELESPARVRAPVSPARTVTATGYPTPPNEPASDATDFAEQIFIKTLGPGLTELDRTVSGSIVPPELHPPSLETTKSGNHVVAPTRIKHLSPLRLCVTLPPAYLDPDSAEIAEGASPSVDVSSLWLSQRQRGMLCVQLEQLWHEGGGAEILYTWIDWILNETIDVLGLGEEITIELPALQQNGSVQPVAVRDNLLQMLAWDKQQGQWLFRQQGQSCEVCRTHKPGPSFTFLGLCDHAVCRSCVEQIVKKHMKTGKHKDTAIRCPIADCNAEVAAFVVEEACRGDEAAFSAWRESRLQSIVTEEGAAYCPRCEAKGAEVPVLPMGRTSNDEVDFSQPCRCHRCDYVFCCVCRSPYHPLATCISNLKNLQDRNPPLPWSVKERLTLQMMEQSKEGPELMAALRYCRQLGLEEHPRYKSRYKAFVDHLMQNERWSWGVDAATELLTATGTEKVLAKHNFESPFALEAFQGLFDFTWSSAVTRDRTSGRPGRFRVEKVVGVRNPRVFMEYVVKRGAVARLKSSGAKWPQGIPDPLTSQWADRVNGPARSFVETLAPLHAKSNEFLLFHGTHPHAAESIVDDNFQLNCAGTNAGTAFGRGIYLAESVTKSDEYTSPDMDGMRTMLVCRVTLGNVLYYDGLAFCGEKLEKACGFGHDDFAEFQSTLADRKKTSGTYREFVLFREDLIYPEFMVFYKRL